MNRKERRAAKSRDKPAAFPVSAGGHRVAAEINDLMDEARRHYQQGNVAQAGNICDHIIARQPSHIPSINLLGLIAQASGRHGLAVKKFSQALALDEFDSACNYNIASSYQALNRRDDAIAHFKKAILLGMSDEKIEDIVLQSPTLGACLSRIRQKWPLPIKSSELFGPPGVVAAVADDVFLRCAMESMLLTGVSVEILLTFIRSALLQAACACAPDFSGFDANVLDFYCALAQQCFTNEYVFAQSDEETLQAGRLRDLLNRKLAADEEIPAPLLVAVASYFPLHSLPDAESILRRHLPENLAGLLRVQIREPMQEAQDRKLIPVLTPIEDGVSLAVRQQYEENPYPRWTINLQELRAAETKPRIEDPTTADRSTTKEILIAGCGTGEHVYKTAFNYPNAHILAIDMSATSLAYAFRMTREAGLRNVEYAQADILKMGSIGRSFERIETVGVLHHLADPKAGWETLLSLLRPSGNMLIGLYSEIARRAIVDARALIAARGYRPTAQDIRACRQEIIRDNSDWRWKDVCASTDFYSISGCRDLLFNVMEHRFTIPEIKSFLSEHGLSFLGFDLAPRSIERFQQQFPNAGALVDLDCWQAFEAANPSAFKGMYLFSVRANQL
jgi:SAM-dependent methyltransferase/tetratricopeptide (TPR) repeat protein